MHPLLLPGTHVVRRGSDELQAGLADRAVALAGGLAPGHELEELYADPTSARALSRAGLLLDDDRPLRAALPAHGTADESTGPWVRHSLAAAARRSPTTLDRALDGRHRHVVVAQPFGHPLSHALADDLITLCRRNGLRLPAGPRPGPPRRDALEPEQVRVLVGVGEPARELSDDLLREGMPHLVVRLVEGRAVVGPFVVPGHTACLRCIDAFLTENDPAWPLLVEQYSRATRRDRADGIPEPVDAALAAVAVGWAVRDLAAHAEGDRPSSWSATITLSSDLAAVATQHWPQHPHCGCAWG
jgi:bacteriocin biosynthesis cyclodehydratase domain-containing protein